MLIGATCHFGDPAKNVGEPKLINGMLITACIHVTIIIIHLRDVPTIFSVLHPLDEPRPVTCKVQGKVCYICDPAVSVVFTCSDPALVMTYDSVIGLHSVWEVTKAKPKVSFLKKSLTSRMNVFLNRAIIKSRRPGISLGCYEPCPGLLS